MRKIVFVVLTCLAAAMAGQPRALEGPAWITPDQIEREHRYLLEHGLQFDELAPSSMTRSIAIPRIRVIAPELAADPITTPVRIELAFSTSSDARILPESFRVLYGFLRVDVTEKVRASARLSETGLVAENAAIPAGSHRLFVSISDDKGRTSEEELRFRVVTR